jgi:hypothetical protein
VTPKDHEDFLDDDDFNEDYPFGFDDSSEETDEHLLSEDYDDTELERRRVAYADLKKNDKIFNNTYNLGLDLSEDEADIPRSGGPEIKLDSSSPDYHLYDPEKYSDHIDLSIIQRDIYEFIKANDRVMSILGSEPDKKKFTKLEINEVFEILNKGLGNGSSANVFINSIHILDSMSSVLSMEYKKIFDQLSYDNKEILLVELNNKYGFLDSMGKNYKIF